MAKSPTQRICMAVVAQLNALAWTNRITANHSYKNVIFFARFAFYQKEYHEIVDDDNLIRRGASMEMADLRERKITISEALKRYEPCENHEKAWDYGSQWQLDRIAQDFNGII